MSIFYRIHWKKIYQGSVASQWKILIAFAASLIMLNYFVWYYPNQAQRIFLENEKASLEQALLLQQHRLEKYRRLLTSIEILEQDLNAITSHWMTFGKISEIGQALLHLCKQSGLTLSLFAQKTPEPSDFYVLFPIKMSIIGTYQQLLCFLREVVALAKGIRFESLEIRMVKNNHVERKTLNLLQMDVVWLIPEIPDPIKYSPLK